MTRDVTSDETPSDAPGPASAETARPRRARTRPGVPGYVIIGLVTALAAAGWGIVMANVGQTPGIAATTVAYRVTGDHAVVVSYDVWKMKSDHVRCVLSATDVNHAEVGRVEVAIPPGTGHVSADVTLRTSARATSASIGACRSL